MPVRMGDAESHTNALIEMLQKRAQAAMAPLAEAIVAKVVEKSPTPEAEYRALMEGDNGSEFNIPPFTGSGSADDDEHYPGTVRFRKEPGTFLQEVAASADNVRVGDVSVSIGNRTLLEESSFFEYIDYVPKKRVKGAPFGASVVGPYFDAFEYGTGDFATWEVTPRGKGYPLRPDSDPSHRPTSMTKVIHARFAYDPIDLDQIARRFLDGTFDNEDRG